MSVGNLERRLRDIWCEVLDVEAAELKGASGFFQLGGNSMLLLSLQMRIAAELQVEIPPARLMQDSDFQGQLSLVRREQAARRR